MPGNPDCKLCYGEGVVPTETKGKHPPSYKRCVCILHQDIIANVERGMKGLSKVGSIKSSPLTSYLDKNVWFTAERGIFLKHLRHVAVRQPPTWFFRVCTDADLMAAWLATAALRGDEIFDADVQRVSLTHMTLMDLVIPPEVLVIRLGVKEARNEATPEVLLEALMLREHEARPTWIWDQPSKRIAEGHRAWSPAIRDVLEEWKHFTQKTSNVPTTLGSLKGTGYSDLSLSGATGSGTGRKTLPRGGEE